MTLTSLRGPLVLGVLCAVPLLLWAQSAPLESRFEGRFASLTSVAVLAAFAGTSAFALNLVLGARLRPVEALFGGLDRMYKAHRVNGQIAFALLLGHVVLILASRATISADTALDLLGPGAGWTVFAGVLAFGALTVSIVLTLFVRLGHEVFVYVQRSFGFVFLAATYHVFTTDGAKADSRALSFYMAALATLGVAAFAYRSLLGNLLVRRRPYRVTAVNRLDEFVTEIVMEPRERPLAFMPGQFVFVNFRSLALREQFRPFDASLRRQVFSIRAGEVSNQFHPFSITAAPGGTELRITVKAVGDYTGALRRLEAGAEAVVEGPYGSFSHRSVPNERQIWLAGGIGVTPFLSMARSLGARSDRSDTLGPGLRTDERAEPARPETGTASGALGDEEGPSVDFYYCVENAAEAHFLDELRAVAERRRDFRVFLVARDEVGFLTAERVAAESGDLASQDVLICGPPAMIDGLRSQLRARGVPEERIHAEEFSFAKLDGTEPRQRRQWSDGQVLALFAALSFAALVFALGVGTR
jgi:predicted ferric reductase